MPRSILFFLSTLTFLVVSLLNSHALTRKVNVTCTNPDVEIHANGKYYGKGSVELLVTKGVELHVTASLPGFISETHVFYYEKGMPTEKAYLFKLKNDDAWEASSKTDIANVDIGLPSAKGESETWKLISTVVMDYFDIIEIADMQTGYIRTAWVVQGYEQSTVRSRVIVKLSSTSPLLYKVKFVSEYASRAGVSAKDDDRFKPWDRVLRKYENMVAELQARLK